MLIEMFLNQSHVRLLQEIKKEATKLFHKNKDLMASVETDIMKTIVDCEYILSK